MNWTNQGGKFRPIGGHRKPLAHLTHNVEHETFAAGYQLTHLLHDHGGIYNLAVCPVTGRFTATSSHNLCFYSGTTFSLERKIADSKKACHGGEFKKNGELFVCGSAEGLVRLYQVNSSIRTALRKFSYEKTGACAARIAKFLDGVNHVLGGFDDGIFRSFDIPTGEIVSQFKAHSERIECAEFNGNLLASGGYDKVVKIWKDSKEVCQPLDHGAPIDSVCWLGSTNLLASSGSGKVKFWDIRNSKEEIGQNETLSCWSKTVTCLDYFASDNLLLAGSLDCSVRTINTNNLSVEKFADASQQVLSMRLLKPDQHTLVLGLASGQIEVHRNTKKLDRMHEAAFANRKVREVKADAKPQEVKKFDHAQKVLTKHFRKFRFRTAFSYALRRWQLYDKDSMEPLLNCLIELERLKAMHQVLGNQDDNTIGSLLAYITKFVFNTKAHQRIKSTRVNKACIVPLLSGLTNLLLDLGYCNSQLYPKSALALQDLLTLLNYEANVTQNLAEVAGVLDMFMSNMS